MNSPITSNHFNDANGNPAGGITYGHGFTIAWQNGPLGRCTCLPVTSIGGFEHAKGLCAHSYNRNGAFVEDIISAAIDRIEYYERSQFACEENAQALLHLRDAKDALESRTSRRVAAGVEGTHEGN